MTPRVQHRIGGVGLTRRLTGVIGFTGAACCMMMATLLHEPIFAVVAIATASFFNDITMPASWTTCMDVGAKYVGTVAGTMNMMGNFGGMAGPLVVGLVLQFTNRDWQLAFLISSIIYFLGAFCWLFIDPVTPLEKTASPPPLRTG